MKPFQSAAMWGAQQLALRTAQAGLRGCQASPCNPWLLTPTLSGLHVFYLFGM